MSLTLPLPYFAVVPLVLLVIESTKKTAKGRPEIFGGGFSGGSPLATGLNHPTHALGYLFKSGD